MDLTQNYISRNKHPSANSDFIDSEVLQFESLGNVCEGLKLNKGQNSQLCVTNSSIWSVYLIVLLR
jgi:hypothetical protein